MPISVGIGFAFVAMLSWGIGDFLVQRSTRKLGNWKTLFLITFFGALLLLPFVYPELPAFLRGPREADGVVLAASLAIFCAALLNLEVLREGKLAVVEPIQPLEIFSAGLLSFVVIGERLHLFQIWLIATLVIGLFLVSYRGHLFSCRFFLERGVRIALLSAAVMGVADFLIGWGARLSDALLVNFVFNVVLALLAGSFILLRGRSLKIWRDLVRYRSYLVPMIIFDNVA